MKLFYMFNFYSNENYDIIIKDRYKENTMIKILICFTMFLFFLTFGVDAKEKVNVYMFRGEGCPHCKEALEFFESIEEEYGKYYKLTTYEVYNDSNNSALMDRVSKRLNEEVSGVPYIIIGKKTFSGFGDDTKDAIKQAILSEYEKDERYDVMNVKSDNTLSIIIMGGLFVLIVGSFYLRFKNTSEV